MFYLRTFIEHTIDTCDSCIMCLLVQDLQMFKSLQTLYNLIICDSQYLGHTQVYFITIRAKKCKHILCIQCLVIEIQSRSLWSSLLDYGQNLSFCTPFSSVLISIIFFLHIPNNFFGYAALYIQSLSCNFLCRQNFDLNFLFNKKCRCHYPLITYLIQMMLK